MHDMLSQTDVSSDELKYLMELREEGKVEFLLIDVREVYEYEGGHIKGVDVNKPTSLFKQWVNEVFFEINNTTVIFTCRTGNRSLQVQKIFSRKGHCNCINHFGGIVTYKGELE